MLVPWRISRVRIRIVFFCCACHNYWRFSWGLHLGLEDTRGTALPSMSWVSGFDMPRHELSQKNIKKPVVVVRSMPLWTRPHFWDVWIPAVKKPTVFFFFREVNGLGQLNPFGVGGFEPPCCVPQRFAQKANWGESQTLGTYTRAKCYPVISSGFFCSCWAVIKTLVVWVFIEDYTTHF